MLLTVCTIAQLPDALTLGTSFGQHHPGQAFVIGLADDPAKLPAGFTCAYPVLTVSDCVAESARYTTTEFTAATKPALIRAALDRFPTETHLLYADPETFIYQPLTPVFARLTTATALLTPLITHPPGDAYWPDEKALQNVGLYSAGFLAFRRSAETDRLLAWWQNRVQERAFIDPCAGLYLDQLWLMYWPVFFEGVDVIHDPGWQLALWNLPERQLTLTPTGWQANGQPLLWANFRGLSNPNAGLFPQQTRLRLSSRPDLSQLLADYRAAQRVHEQASLRAVRPSYGVRPEPVVLRGWRQRASTAVQQLIHFIDRVPIPVIR